METTVHGKRKELFKKACKQEHKIMLENTPKGTKNYQKIQVCKIHKKYLEMEVAR